MACFWYKTVVFYSLRVSQNRNVALLVKLKDAPAVVDGDAPAVVDGDRQKWDLLLSVGG